MQKDMAGLAGPHGEVLPGTAEGLWGAETAANPANTIKVRIEERSNAFMGRSPVFCTLLTLVVVLKFGTSIHIAERFPIYFFTLFR